MLSMSFANILLPPNSVRSLHLPHTALDYLHSHINRVVLHTFVFSVKLHEIKVSRFGLGLVLRVGLASKHYLDQ
jgi:hypothetical protein